MMARYGRRSTADDILGVLSLNPLPYPVLLLLGVMFIFLGLRWYVSYDTLVENTQEGMGWFLMAVPLVLILAVWLLSSMERPERLIWGGALSPWDRHRRMRYHYPEGSSPWVVAAIILLLLVLLQYQSSFLDSWFIGRRS